MPLPRRPNADLARLPGRLRGRASGGARRSSTGSGPTSSAASAASSRCRRTSPPASGTCRWSCTRATRCPGCRQQAGRPVHRRTSPRRFPDTTLRHATYVGLPIRRMISTLDRAALRDEARASFGLRRGPADAAGHRRLAGRRVASTGPCSARARRSPRPACRCCTSTGPSHEATVPGDRRRRTSCSAYVDRMDLAYSAADAVLCRAGSNTVTEVSGVGLPGGLRAAADRQRRAGAQRAGRDRGRRRAAGRRRRPHARVGRRARRTAACATATGWPPWARPPPA